METRDLSGAHGLGDEAWVVVIEDRRALDTLFVATYEELRRLASSLRAGRAGATLDSIALVHEAWVKLAGSASIGVMSELHFKRIAARAMRQVLVEAARRRQTHKRGGGVDLVTLDDELAPMAAGTEELLALDEALESLAQLHPRQAMIVESRFFGGIDVPGTARLLQVSEATVARDWRAARAWLARELRR
jgi:RNA polymerase sigma-70 factor, ECF subfamily